MPRGDMAIDECRLPIQFALGQRYESPSAPRTTLSSLLPDRNLHSPNLQKIPITWHTPVPLSRAQLARKREEFWETAPIYGGILEVWDAIHEAVEMGHQDMETARMILNCAGVTTPHGVLTEAYDERGYRYTIPPYCLCDPAEGTVADQEEEPLQHLPDLGDTYELRRLKIRLSLGCDEDIDVPDSPNLCIGHVRQMLEERLKLADRIEFFWAGHGPLSALTRLSSLKSGKHTMLLQAWILENKS